MKQITAVIIDDEEHSVESLQLMLGKYCSNIGVAAIAYSADEGIEQINKFRPDLVFLDIQMPGKTGFDMLKSIPERNFDVIFVTAYDQYAIKAIKYSALDYLLKPIDKDELIGAISAWKEKGKQYGQYKSYPDFLENLSGKAPSKLAIHTMDGIHFIDLKEVVHIKGEGNYSTIFMENGEKIMTSRGLKEFEDILGDDFFRSHQSHIIKLDKVKSFKKTDGGYIEMSEGSEILLSRRKKDIFIQLMNKLAR